MKMMILLCFWLVLAVRVQAQTDFSGAWVLIPGSIKALSGEENQNPMPKQLKVRQTADSLSVQTLRGTDIGDITTYKDLSLSGKPMESLGADHRKRVTIPGWDEGQKILVLTTTLYAVTDSSIPEIKLTEVWALAEKGGKTILALLQKSTDIKSGIAWSCSATYEQLITNQK